VTEEDLGHFLRSVMGSEVFDYSVQSVATFAVANEGWVKQGDEMVLLDGSAEPADGEEEMFRSEVVVRRLGGASFPVEVLLAFEDGHEVRHKWRGKRRWKLFVEEYPSRLEYAVIDPDGILALDIHPSNNSREVKSKAQLPAWKWAARWTVWLQDFFSTFGFFV